MSKRKPTIYGIGENIGVGLGKRLEYINGSIVFECPECGHKMRLLDDPADLEYGSFYGVSECWDCGTEFEEYDFEVESFVKITLKEKKND